MGLGDIFKRNREEESEDYTQLQDDETAGNVDENTLEDESLYDEEDIYSDYSDGIKEDIYSSNEDRLNDDELYTNTEEDKGVQVDSKELKKKLDSLARTGCNIVVTGCTGSGTTSVAFNMAMTLARLGYSTLIVDLDTLERAQSYISSKNYSVLGTDSLALEKAVNTKASLGSEVGIVRKDLYLIGLGAAVDAYELDQTIKVENIAKLLGEAKAQFSFAVYDVPLSNITKYSKELAMLSDKLLLVMESNTSGIMRTVSMLTNTDDEVLRQAIFSKATPVFNKMSSMSTLMAKKFKGGTQGAKQIDNLITSLAGGDIGLHIEDMNIPINIEYSEDYDTSWYTSNSVCETQKGEETYIRVISSIV